MSESRLLDMRECGDPQFAAIHREMIAIAMELQPAWFRPLLRRSARLKRWTGHDHWSRAWEYPWAIRSAELGDARLRTLDVGGGGGPFAHYLARRGHDSHVVDPSLDRGVSFVLDRGRGLYRNVRSMTKRWAFRAAGINSVWGLPERRRTGPVRYVSRTAESTGYPDRHFDRVFCLSVMEHIPTRLWSSCMREFDRILAPGGRLIITLDMETADANDRRYLNLVEASSLTLLGDPYYDVPLRSEDQQSRHPGQYYETIGLVWTH